MTPPNPPDVPALIQRAEQLRADIARASQMTDPADAANCALEASNVIAGLLALLTARETALITAQQERDKETHRLKLAIDDYNEVKAERDALRDQVAHTDSDVAALIQRAQRLTEALEWEDEYLTKAHHEVRGAAGSIIRDLLALLTARETALPRAVDLMQQLAGKQCVQCGGSIDAEAGRCKACDERDAYLEAQVTALETALITAQQERDEARKERDRWRDDPAVGHMKADIYNYRHALEGIAAERDALRTEVERLRQQLAENN